MLDKTELRYELQSDVKNNDKPKVLFSGFYAACRFETPILPGNNYSSLSLLVLINTNS